MKLYKRLSENPFLVAGPCVMESLDLLRTIADKLVPMAEKLDLVLIFKASFDKANRTSVSSYRGPGLEQGLEWLKQIQVDYNVPVTTDIHESYQAAAVGEVADIIQIPAFLSRQTDLLVAAAETGKIVNIKKAQFLTGKEMKYPAQKVVEAGNQQVLLTERGSSFGPHNLVVDYRGVVDMQQLGYPIVMDVTHSCQQPGGAGGKSGGNRFYAPYLANAAAAVGVRGFFFETHPNPDKALSDGPNMIPLNTFAQVLQVLKQHIDLAAEQPPVQLS